MRAFHDFLLSSAPTSFSYLRELEFSSYIKADDLHIVVDILTNATNLRSLALAISLGSAEEIGQDIAEAIISLSKLQSLTFDYGYDNVEHTVLKRLQAPLKYLSLQEQDSPLLLLSNFQDTLEYLYLEFAVLEDVDVPVSCVNLTRLRLNYCPRPVLSVLVNTFPNLQVLSLKSGRAIVRLDYERQGSNLRELRTKNLSLQAHRRLNSLTSLTTDEAGLYTMGLQSEIDSIIIPCAFASSDYVDYNLNWLHTSLRSLRPRHLQLTCDVTTRLQQALSIGTERLDRLDLLVKYSGSLLKDIVDGICTALKSLPVRMIFCDISMYYAKRTRVIPPNEWNRETILQKIMLAAPQVAYIKLVVTTLSENVSYWTVAGDGDERRLHEVKSKSEIAQINRMFLPVQLQVSCLNQCYGYHTCD
ncbi:hypothetical protein EIP86_001927 [Pleurotus ostreatoroseus]|nr:hypothetical protein EIP86_001927 [Pleurotus ostreatoroseus]